MRHWNLHLTCDTGSEEKHYTYTIITTDSNKQLKFLHDRMPVILENGSEDIRTWLDPNRYTWSKELQSLLVPFQGELEVYPVSKEVGKVGNNSPNFIIPVASSENKSNIANFFAKGMVIRRWGLYSFSWSFWGSSATWECPTAPRTLLSPEELKLTPSCRSGEGWQQPKISEDRCYEG